MRNLKRMAALLLAFALLFAMGGSALAAVEDTGFADVDAGIWYAEATVYCRDKGLMSGTSDTIFEPDASMTRAMLAAVLYRLAGNPAVTGSDVFTDTVEGAWYADAVLWASQNGVVSGYGGGLFGTDDPVTREQMAAILWRYAGSPETETGANFADQSAIAAWAVSAVNWARQNGYMSGVEDNRFDPSGTATRAQVALILMRYDQGEQPAEPEPAPSADVLVAYFSCTGNTEAIAEHLGVVLDADLYEIVPEEPYTDADLDYSNTESRTSVEMNDPTARPAIAGGVENLEAYDIIFLGYPIWWGDAPRIISTFLESYDFSGKTIVPFCTSGSSGIGSSATALQGLTKGATWLDGQRFSGGASEETVRSWVDGLHLESLAAA